MFRISTHGRNCVPYLAVVVVVAASSLSACSSPAGKSASGEAGGASTLPAVIKVLSLRDMTGTLAYAGTPTVNGSRVAIDEINSSHYLGGSTTLEMDVEDASSNAQTAASLMASAVASKKYPAILGPFNSAESLVVAPAAEKAQLPVVFTESNVDGVLLGKYTWRGSTPIFAYYGQTGQFLKNKGVKSISVLYNSSVASLVKLNKLISDTFETQFGIRVLSNTAVQATTQDFSGPASKIVAEKPDSVAMLLTGPTNATAVQQLRQAGFGGQIVASNGAGAGNLSGAGPTGAGVVWPTNFNVAQQDSVAKGFVATYRSKFAADPNNFAAEGYDAAWFLARAIKEAGNATPSGIAQGLASVASVGFTGAAGKLTFEGQDMRSLPVFVQWDGTKEVLIAMPPG